jgi:flagellar hook protein FlgE
VAGDTITVNGTSIQFGTGPNQIDPATATVQTLLTKIDSITGTTTPSTVSSAGVITLHSGPGGGLSIRSSNPAALGALGFDGTVTVAAPPNALATSFAPGDVITVDGTQITFVAANAIPVGNQIRVTDTVGSLLGMIGSITGVQPTINSSTGAITLHTGTVGNLSVSSNAPGFAALGFATTMTAARTGGGTGGTGFVVGNDITAFTNETISGGAVTAYNAAGTPVNLQLRWAKTDSASLGSPHQDSWNLFYQTDPTATGTEVGWVNVGQNFTFNSDGSLSSPAGSAITIPGVTVSGQSLGSLTLNLGSGGLTQFASTGGTATINTISQNGYAAGQLQSVAINNNGLVVGTFSNGQNIDLASVTLSHFNGTNYLKALDGGAYAVTDQSGPAIAGASGSISGSSLEGSNTDIADQFTKLIVTQQAYSANTKVITTANDMVQSLLAVIR